MKKLLLAVVGIMFAATSFAQNALVASLSHGESVSYYYGVTALQQAVAAAESGDFINLSSGSFNATNITKAITLRGTGVDNKEPTYIANDFTINIPTEDANRFMMEGIRCVNRMEMEGTFSNPYFVKCQFNNIGYSGYSQAITNIMFANCKITGSFDTRGSNTYSMVNCYINHFTQNEASFITANNCLIVDNGFHIYTYRQTLFTNCIFVSSDGKGGYSDSSGATRYLPNNSQAKDCVAINFPESFNIFHELPFSNGCSTSPMSYATVFKTFTGTYSDEETFELTDDILEQYPNLGLYGGPIPFDLTPSYPLIISLTTDSQTDADGKLNNVNVVVSNPQKKG